MVLGLCLTAAWCAGVNVLAEDNAPSFILVNAIFLLGTFFFAVVLGVVSDDIGNELKVKLEGWTCPHIFTQCRVLYLAWGIEECVLFKR